MAGLTGKETLQVLGQSPSGVPAASTFQTTTQDIADLGALIAAVTVIAAAGATQGAATAIPAAAVLVNVSTTTSSEGVKLPTAVTGKSLTILPPTTKGVQVYGGAAGQLINANTTATTAFAMTSGKPLSFYAVDATHWRVTSPSLNTSSLASLLGGQTLGGQLKFITATVKATGNAVTNARTVGVTASYIIVNTSASTEGVKLPTPSTGLQVTIAAPTALAVLVYASAAGQSIGTGTTNTTAFKITANTSTTFTAVSATKWRVSVA